MIVQKLFHQLIRAEIQIQKTSDYKFRIFWKGKLEKIYGQTDQSQKSIAGHMRIDPNVLEKSTAVMRR